MLRAKEGYIRFLKRVAPNRGIRVLLPSKTVELKRIQKGSHVTEISVNKNPNIEIVAVNDLADTKTLAHLLNYDSVLGNLHADVKAGDGVITVNGKSLKVFACKDPGELPWSSVGADYVVESTGRFTDKDKAVAHMKGGAKKVIISAPAKDEDITIVICSESPCSPNTLSHIQHSETRFVSASSAVRARHSPHSPARW